MGVAIFVEPPLSIILILLEEETIDLGWSLRDEVHGVMQSDQELDTRGRARVKLGGPGRLGCVSRTGCSQGCWKAVGSAPPSWIFLNLS